MKKILTLAFLLTITAAGFAQSASKSTNTSTNLTAPTLTANVTGKASSSPISAADLVAAGGITVTYTQNGSTMTAQVTKMTVSMPMNRTNQQFALTSGNFSAEAKTAIAAQKTGALVTIDGIMAKLPNGTETAVKGLNITIQ